VATQITEIGLGRALRTARLRQGLTTEDASLGTRLRAEYLDALEREAWGELPGDVYVRSFLRSYATFLGLSPQKVIAFFERGRGVRLPAPAPVDRSPAVAAGGDDALTGGRSHFHWPMAAAVAVIVLVSAAAIGLFSRSGSTPEPAGPPPSGQTQVLPDSVQVDMIAIRDVEARITVDGVSAFTGTLKEDEARSFQGSREIRVWLATGSLVRMRVNGKRIGTPGEPVEAFQRVFDRTDFREERSGSG
jgi:hypothetical protein